MKELLRLFKAIEIKTKRRKKLSRYLLTETLKYGFIFSQEVFFNYSEAELENLIKVITKEIGLTPEQLNSSFHKSWQKVKEADLEQLVVEQLAHYLTTYGQEQPKEYLIEKEEQWGVDNLAEKVIELGDFKSDKIKDKNYIYISTEKLELPELDIDGINLVVIRGYTAAEIKVKLFDLICSGIALKEDTIKDVVAVFRYFKFEITDIELVKNKEVKIALCDYLSIFPENPVELLRYAIYRLTGRTLLIKDSATIEAIKNSEYPLKAFDLFNKYKNKHGLEKLASTFYRFKPLFLAFKSLRGMIPIINRIRKLATKHHRAMPVDYLNEITSDIKKGIIVHRTILKNNLDKVNNFRKIRLACALNYRVNNIDSILYKIRNGKSFSTAIPKFNAKQKKEAKAILNITLDSLVDSIKSNIKGKKIYIPEYINYALPATEKQFTGDFPSGTCVTVPKDIVFGVHWNNVKGHSIDLDLSLMNMEGDKFGWDANYRNEEGSILFSGDITDARGENGATELFYIKRQRKHEHILFVNYYNFMADIEVPFEIITAQEQVKNLKKNYMVNPNNVKAISKTNINRKQKMLGLLVTTTEKCKFYFCETYLGNSITASGKPYVKNTLEYLSKFYQNPISLNEILIKAGAKMVSKKDDCDIDLSPENLEKDKIIGLLK